MNRRRAFDHLLLVQRHPVEVGRFCAAIAKSMGEARGAVLDLQVVHEQDDGCCRREPWPVTMMLLLAAHAAEGGTDARS